MTRRRRSIAAALAMPARRRRCCIAAVPPLAEPARGGDARRRAALLFVCVVGAAAGRCSAARGRSCTCSRSLPGSCWPSRSSRSACCSRWSPRRCGSSTRSTRSATCAATTSRARPASTSASRVALGAHHGHRLRRQPVHAVPVLRDADARRPIRSSTHKANDGGDPRRAHLSRAAARLLDAAAAAGDRRAPGCSPARSTSRPAASSPARSSAALLGVLLALYVFGIGKAAVMPLHFWLPAAMVAPTPVSALLHAVAVVKAGVFAILKVIVYVFGVERAGSSGAATGSSGSRASRSIAASLVALRQDNLKQRLAYSTVCQLSYVVLAAAILTPISVVGAALHIAAHAVAKITLFFAAGSIYTAAHKTEVSQLDGIGRRMPWTMARLRHRRARHDRPAADGRLPRQVVHALRARCRPASGCRSRVIVAEHRAQRRLLPADRRTARSSATPRARPARARTHAARRGALADGARARRDGGRHRRCCSSLPDIPLALATAMLAR